MNLTRDDILGLYHQAGLPIESEEHLARLVKCFEGLSYEEAEDLLVIQPLQRRLAARGKGHRAIYPPANVLRDWVRKKF
jgi:hypothetical protein